MMVVTWITVGRWPIINWWVLSFDLWFLSSAGEQQQQIGLDLAPTATQEDMPADTQKAEKREKQKIIKNMMTKTEMFKTYRKLHQNFRYQK